MHHRPCRLPRSRLLSSHLLSSHLLRSRLLPSRLLRCRLLRSRLLSLADSFFRHLSGAKIEMVDGEKSEGRAPG